MAHPLWPRVEPLVAELDRNPLYRASGAAMELFHSNVLAWALRTHPRACTSLSQLLGLDPADEYDVRREWQHLDLAVGVDGTKPGAVLENKITARSDADQLDRYQTTLEEVAPEFARRASFVLLSLLAPVFDLPGRWRYVDYGQLSEAMLDVAGGLAGFDADFTRQYGRLTRLLADLVAAAGIGTTLSEAYFIDPETEQLLRKAGVRDLILKVRSVDLVQRLVAKRTYGQGGWHEATWSQGRPIASRFTRQEAVDGVGPLHLGWQLQGSHLRIVALLRDPSLYGKGLAAKARREDAADRYLGSWIDTEVLRSIASLRMQPYAGKLKYNHFDPDFIYRYGKLDLSIKCTELIGGLADLSRAAEEHLTNLGGHPFDAGERLPE